MSHDEESDDLVLHALELYQHAIHPAGADLAVHRSHFRPVSVALNAFDGIEVQYLRLGAAPWTECANLPVVGDLPAAVVALAGLFQDKELTGGDNTWPGCLPGHPHPPEPGVVAGVACWRCPRTDATVSVIGAAQGSAADRQ